MQEKQHYQVISKRPICSGWSLGWLRTQVGGGRGHVRDLTKNIGRDGNLAAMVHFHDFTHGAVLKAGIE